MASTTTYTTTLTVAVGLHDDYVEVADPTGIQNPDSGGAHNSTQSILQIDQEYMAVTARYVLGSKIVPVVRGLASGAPNVGSDIVVHAQGATVTITTEDSRETTFV
jgi:hypothetical protein